MSETNGKLTCTNGKARLLVVDDDESARITLAIALRRQGFQVHVTEDGDSALDILGRDHFDWVISDIRMPGMTGIELASKINLLFRDVRCILVSAFAIADELTELGVVACLEKPIDPDRLLSLLHNGTALA